MFYKQQDMVNRICMVTGANRGIGRATAQGLANLGATLILVCRDQIKGNQARDEIARISKNPKIDLIIADLSLTQQIRKLADDFSTAYDRLDVLINGATGIFHKRELSGDNIEMNFGLNYLPYFTLPNLLINSLISSSSARVINVSTESHRGSEINFDDLFFENDYNPITAYMQAKLANILTTYELAHKLKGTHITVNCLDPGVVDTQGLAAIRDSARRIYGDTPSSQPVPLKEGAKASLYLATATNLEGVSGKYFVDMKETESSDCSNNLETAKMLWELSEEISGVKIDIKNIVLDNRVI